MDRAVRTPNLHPKAERLLKVKFPDASQGQNVFHNYWSVSDATQRLTLIDFFLRDLEDEFDYARKNATVEDDLLRFVEPITALDGILVEGGSIWETMYTPHWGLRRRVNDTTKALVDVASSPSTDAARKIA